MKLTANIFNPNTLGSENDTNGYDIQWGCMDLIVAKKCVNF
jgi:hypothetical protein